jgi:NAD-dependent DNA ligase
MATRPTGRQRTLEALTPDEKRVIQELHKFCAHIVYDGQLDDAEFVQLTEWVRKHKAYAEVKPLSDLMKLLRSVLADGMVTADERMTLVSFLSHVVKQPKPVMDGLEGIFETDDRDIDFSRSTFCFSGTFGFGNRTDARIAVMRLGGKVVDQPSMKLDWLVMGAPGPETTRAGVHPSKLERVIRYVRQGARTRIVREATFTKAIIAADTKR